MLLFGIELAVASIVELLMSSSWLWCFGYKCRGRPRCFAPMMGKILRIFFLAMVCCRSLLSCSLLPAPTLPVGFSCEDEIFQ